MVTDFLNNVIIWAQTQNFITLTQDRAAKNIVNVIEALESQGMIGIQKEDYLDLVFMASSIETAIAEGILEWLKYLILSQNQRVPSVVPPDISPIITIISNIEVLVGHKLNDNQKVAFNQLINVLPAINKLPQNKYGIILT